MLNGWRRVIRIALFGTKSLCRWRGHYSDGHYPVPGASSVRTRLQERFGVPVVEGFGAPIRMAALLAGLGLKHSRVRLPKSRSAQQ